MALLYHRQTPHTACAIHHPTPLSPDLTRPVTSYHYAFYPPAPGLGFSKNSGPKLHLTFKQSPRLEVLDKYLAAKCQEHDRFMFPRVGSSPTETEVLNAIGWSPSAAGEEGKNWEKIPLHYTS